MPRRVTLPMRCSASGRKFHAVCEWDPALKRYVLQTTVPLPRDPPDMGRFARTIAGLFRSNARQLDGVSYGAVATDRDAATDFDLEEFQFDGFSCPLCGYGKTVPLTERTQFVKCGRCRELVCGKGISKSRGSGVFRCHKQCGFEGELAGPITSAKGLVDAPTSRMMDTAPEPTAKHVIKAAVQPKGHPAIEPPAEPNPRAALDARRPENGRILGPPSRGLPPPDPKR